MTLRQQQPIVAGVLDQLPTRLDEALLETDQRPTINALGEHQPPSEISEVVGQYAQLQPDLVRSEPVTRQARPMRRLLAFLDPLLRRPALVVKPHDGTILERKIRQNEADALEQLADVVLDLGSVCNSPTGCHPPWRVLRVGTQQNQGATHDPVGTVPR